MKHNLKRKWIIALSAAAAIFAFGGCSMQMTKEEFLSKNGLTTEVTYYANGGCFDDDFEKVKKTIWYKSNSYAYEITETSLNGKQMIEYEDYEFLGWYYAQLDSNNVPMKDEKGNMLLGEEVPFDQPIANWTTTHIVASWASLSKVKVKLVIGDEGDAIDANEKINIETRFGNDYEWKLCGNGDEIRDYSFSNGIMQSTTTLTLKVEDNAYTFLNFYGDEACTQPVAWPLTKPDKDAEEKDVYIYAKYIKGNWTMLSIASDVRTMFTSSATNDPTTRYFMKNDIDCSSLTAVAPRVKFNCELNGNGHTISGLKFSKTNNFVTDASYAFLGKLDSSAKITNITFANLQMRYQTMENVSIYFAFAGLESGAVVDNVSFSGTLTIKLAKNIPDGAGGTYDAQLNNDSETNWKYGGFDTDDAYTGNCTVEGEVIFE